MSRRSPSVPVLPEDLDILVEEAPSIEKVEEAIRASASNLGNVPRFPLRSPLRALQQQERMQELAQEGLEEPILGQEEELLLKRIRPRSLQRPNIQPRELTAQLQEQLPEQEEELLPKRIQSRSLRRPAIVSEQLQEEAALLPSEPVRLTLPKKISLTPRRSKGLSKELSADKQIKLEKSVTDLHQAEQILEEGGPGVYERFKEKVKETYNYLMGTSDFSWYALLFTLVALALNIWYWMLHSQAVQQAAQLKKIMQTQYYNPVNEAYNRNMPVPAPAPAPVPTPVPTPSTNIVNQSAIWFGGLGAAFLLLSILLGFLYLFDKQRHNLWKNLDYLSLALSIIFSIVAISKYYF